jgi:hypothetical protein
MNNRGAQNKAKFKKNWYMTPSEAFFAPQNAPIYSLKLTLEVLKVDIFRFKMQKDLIWAYDHCTAEKSPK